MAYNYTSLDTSNDGLYGPRLEEYCSASTFVAFATLLATLIRTNDKISGINERITPVESADDEYDFVVIGSGAGGSPVAARLSENPEWKVLLLEAGEDEPVESEVPFLFLTVSNTNITWTYKTSNESSACLSSGGACALSGGKMLGGTTARNALRYVRGNPSDYDGWAALGNEGWSYEDVLPYFKKGEDNRDIDKLGSEYHGSGGPLSVESFRYLPEFGLSILDAAVEAGYTLSEDLNGEDITGFSVIQGMTKEGVRSSSSAAYLRPARNRTNLHISLNSTASRLIIENGKAVGVEYYKNGELKTVSVSKEVIVSAGTIESAKLLLLSGIGPKEHLESVGVDVVHDLPGVGENFHDEMIHFVRFYMDKPDIYEYNWVAAAAYLEDQTGPLSSIGAVPVMGVFASNQTTPNSPDVRVGFAAYMTTCAPAEVDAARTSGNRTFTAYVTNIRPKSRGRLTLASNNYTDSPVIWGNYLGDPADLARMVEGVEMILPLTNTPTMQAYNITMSTTVVSACSDYTFASSEYWACTIRQSASSDHHPAGTCKMGPSTDPMAVVDPRLRVHGIEGLRVADASIMPQTSTGNNVAPIMMIGERAADFIKSDWNQDSQSETSSQNGSQQEWRNSESTVPRHFGRRH